MLSHITGFGFAATIVLALVSFILLVLCWRYWGSLSFNSDWPEKRSSVRWSLRPSNLLLVLAAGFYLYPVLYGGKQSQRTAIILVILAVVIRYWENDALKDTDVKESDVENARAELLKAEEKGKGESSSKKDDID